MIEQAINALDLIELGSPDGIKRKIRGQLGSIATDTFFNSLAYAGRFHPLAHPRLHGVSVENNIRYGQDHDRQKLDIYRPVKKSKKPLSVVFYVHGGGFRALSRKTHWLVGLIFAQKGYLLVNVDYGLAPQHRYPQPLQDIFKAYEWVIKHADGLGADPSKIMVAGDSAGANLILALTCAFHYERPESYARQLRSLGNGPVMVLPKCGILQISDIDRYERNKLAKSIYIDLMHIVSNSYFTSDTCAHQPASLADPLRIIEEDEPSVPLPPIFASVGTADPLIHDTMRLKHALAKHDTASQIASYDGEIHAFQMLVWRKQARRCWRDTFDFINRHWPK